MSSFVVNNFKQYIEHGKKDKITDFTVDNKCSNCGNCCNDILPVNKQEIKRIKQYIKEHNIKEENNFMPTAHKSLNMMCPFRNDRENKCNIYEVRPKICRLFLCSNEAEAKKNREEFARTRTFVDFRDEFYNSRHF